MTVECPLHIGIPKLKSHCGTVIQHRTLNSNKATTTVKGVPFHHHSQFSNPPHNNHNAQFLANSAMKSHLTSATQRAKDIAFRTTHAPNEPQNDVFVPEHRPPPSHDINTSTLPLNALTPSHHQRHAPMSYLNLLLLTFIFAVSLIFAIYFVFHTYLRGYAPSFEDVAPLYAKKLQKRRPPPLELVGGGRTDVEAQALRLVAVGGEQAGRVRSHSLGEGSSWWKEVMATGVEGEGEGLTPFSAARARARRYGEGDVEAKGTEGEDELGLGRYFFGDGVGIMRYESWGEARGWREG